MGKPLFAAFRPLLLRKPRVTGFESLFSQGFSPSSKQRTGDAGFGVVPDSDVMLLRPLPEDVGFKAFRIAEYSEFRLILAIQSDW
ncbi:hypothetical protein Rwratislav_03936 [Rhodococcus wratislaviensis IFP 2016]|uniref:Uncharacterized protein n=1 Tax=Rhodococcus opacus M213 TaxID=1129896 RepID=K8XP80_RHOOP|nr:hypothetical protein WSS_A07309 [Rhodococcus opacus M213]ELB94428.1 hypothetical protein Rwratislav_03936 [Rhodococcus wratislaviensis IFP 2016]